MSNMAAELGAQAGLIAPDEVTESYVTRAGGSMSDDWTDYRIEVADRPEDHLRFDAAALSPQIAAPHSPANAADAARGALAEMGVSIEDTPDGTIWRLAPTRGTR